MGKSQMQELLHLQAVAIAMSDGAHLFTLREMNRRFISKCFESYPKDAGLRPPNRVEAELADQKLWQQIATLFNEEDWSLDQAIREVVVARNEIGVQLMPLLRLCGLTGSARAMAKARILRVVRGIRGLRVLVRKVKAHPR